MSTPLVSAPECFQLSPKFYRSLEKVELISGDTGKREQPATARLKRDAREEVPKDSYCIAEPFNEADRVYILKHWFPRSAEAVDALAYANGAALAICSEGERFSKEIPGIEQRAREKEAARHSFPWGGLALSAFSGGILGAGLVIGYQRWRTPSIATVAVEEGPVLGHEPEPMEGSGRVLIARIPEPQVFSLPGGEQGSPGERTLIALRPGALTGPQVSIDGERVAAMNLYASRAADCPTLLSITKLKGEGAQAVYTFDLGTVRGPNPSATPIQSPTLRPFIPQGGQAVHPLFVTGVFLDMVDALQVLRKGRQSRVHNGVALDHVQIVHNGQAVLGSPWRVAVRDEQSRVTDTRALGRMMIELAGGNRNMALGDIVEALGHKGVPPTLAARIAGLASGLETTTEVNGGGPTPSCRQAIAREAIAGFTQPMNLGLKSAWQEAMHSEENAYFQDQCERILQVSQQKGLAPHIRRLPTLLVEADYLSPDIGEGLQARFDKLPWNQQSIEAIISRPPSHPSSGVAPGDGPPAAPPTASARGASAETDATVRIQVGGSARPTPAPQGHQTKMSMLDSPAVHPILHGIARDSVAMVSGGILAYGLVRGLEDAGCVKIKPGTRQAAIAGGMAFGLYGSMAASVIGSCAKGGVIGLATNLAGLSGVMALSQVLPFHEWSTVAADASVDFFCKTFDVHLSPETAMMARAVVQNGYNFAMISIAMRVATPALGAVFAPVARAALPLAQAAWVRVAPQLMNGLTQGSRMIQGATVSLQTGTKMFLTPNFA